MPYMRPNYADTALPGANATVTFYNSNVLNDGIAKNTFASGCITRYSLDLKNDQAGTLTLEKSKDGGTNWVTVYSIAVAAAGANATNHYEIPIAGFQDLRVKFVNGAAAQTTFVVDQELDDLPINPGASGLGGSGAAQAAADAMANPTEDGTISYTMVFNGTTWDRIRSAVVAKVSTFTGLLNAIGMGRYNLTPPTLTDGDVQILQLDSAGNSRVAEMFAAVAEDNTNGVIATQVKPLAATTYAPTQYNALGTATTAAIKGSAGNLFSFTASNRNGASRWLILFNSTGSTATPLAQWVVPPGSTIVVGTDFFTQAGWNFSTGITWGMSTTAGSYMAATASETDMSASYI